MPSSSDGPRSERLTGDLRETRRECPPANRARLMIGGEVRATSAWKKCQQPLNRVGLRLCSGSAGLRSPSALIPLVVERLHTALGWTERHEHGDADVDATAVNCLERIRNEPGR